MRFFICIRRWSTKSTIIMCILNHCLEWDKWVFNERTYPTPDSGLTHLLHGRGRSQCSLHCAGLVTPECTRGVIDPLYHSRHNGRDRQYECDCGINIIKRPPYRPHYACCPSVCLSVPYGLLTRKRKRKKIKIGVLSQDTSKWRVDFQMKRSKVKVTGGQKPLQQSGVMFTYE